MKKLISLSIILTMLFANLNMVSVYAATEILVQSKNVTKSGENNTPAAEIDWYREGKTTFSSCLVTNQFDMTTGSWGRYSVMAPLAGNYSISVFIKNIDKVSDISIEAEGNQKVSYSVSTTGNVGATFSDIGRVQLNAGENIVKVINEGPGNYIFYRVKFTKLDSLSVTSSSITDVMNRGTDKFEFEFNTTFNSVSSSNVILKSSDGEEISLEAEWLNGKLVVYLTESLDYDKDYTLTLTGLEPTSNSIVTEGDIPLEFSTCLKENDNGSATVEITDKKYDAIDGKMVIEGIVKASTGKGIAKREVVAYDENDQELGKTTSLENGVFELQIPFEEDENIQTATDIFECKVSSEYTSPVNVQIEYMTKRYETIMLGKFNTDDVSVVEAAFGEHYEDLSLTTYLSDIDTLANKNLFFKHFMQEFMSAEEISTLYSKMFLLETLNQTNNFDVAKAIFENEADCDKIGISFDKISSIVNNKTGFVNEYISLEASENLETFYAKIDNLSRKWLMTEFGKSDVVLSADDVSANSGQQVSIPLTLAAEQKDVKELTIEVTCDDSSVLPLISYECLTGEDDVINVENGEIHIVFAAKKDIKEVIGKINIVAPAEAKVYNLTLSGNVSCEVGNNVELDCNIVEDQFSLTVTLMQPSTNRPVVSGGGGGGGGSSSAKPTPTPTPTPAPTEKDEPENPTSSKPPVETEQEVYFADLADVEWAADSINALVRKNVIAKAADNNFNPSDNITREEFIKLIVMAIGEYDENIESEFSDVPNGHWAEKYIASAEKIGLVYGNESNEFGLNQNISRQDMATIICRTLTLLGYPVTNDTVQFSDKEQISPYAIEAVSMLSNLGIINGIGNNCFAPLGVATRAQAARIIFAMMEVLGI